MNITLGTAEIFEIAKEIELKGARFYREAAEKISNNEIKQALLELAAMEDGHLEAFRQMEKELIKQEKDRKFLVPDNKAALYLQTIANDSEGIHIKSNLDKLTDNVTMAEIFELAIDAEKSSLLFYVGLKELVSTKAEKDKVEAIIKEELGHIIALNLNLTVLQ